MSLQLSKSPPVSSSQVPSPSSSFVLSVAEQGEPNNWSTGAKKSLKEEAMESLKAMTPTSVDTAKSPPSAVQALLGGVSAGVIALILNKFTTTIKASPNCHTLSDNF